jgi:hypothetical protein
MRIIFIADLSTAALSCGKPAHTHTQFHLVAAVVLRSLTKSDALYKF